ncbi:hypothetical protein ON064_00130 [Planococcus sp. A6]|uniref:hypothetical protein n=1 Tax=Planococcus sp. A6 TaxID=2992760 RepID=UPI00237A8F7E|nr:hypothetical protein [Planococcus sp. A6]MDE0581456.1 hypothetical protein [Planococcus sp. A6]
MDSYKEYLVLLSKSYEDAIEWLLQKYGSAQDDYFREASYQRFMNGEIKNITKGKFSRTTEGLYCHHIDEIKWLKISDQDFVKDYSIPFESQRKNRLVHCDLAEHTILHVLITKETSFEYGYPGYEVFLKRLMEEWYLDERKPNPDWMKRCYLKSFLKPQQAFELVKEMQRVLVESYFNSLEDYFEEKKKREEQIQQWQEQRKQRRIDESARWIEVAKQLHHKSLRNDIVTASYFIRVEYRDVMDLSKQATTFKEYDREMKKYRKEEILDELLVYIKSF